MLKWIKKLRSVCKTPVIMVNVKIQNTVISAPISEWWYCSREEYGSRLKVNKYTQFVHRCLNLYIIRTKNYERPKWNVGTQDWWSFPQSSAKISHSSSGRGEREGAGLTPRQTGYICDLPFSSVYPQWEKSTAWTFDITPGESWHHTRQ